MAEHVATISWIRVGPDFAKGKFSREHTWKFDGGVTVAASPSPSVVPAPWSNPEGVDPEEAFVAAIASCHMLTFLWLASRAGFVVESYEDTATGALSKNERGVPWVSDVTLRPSILWSGDRQPTPEEIDKLHHNAHEQCFIAQSVRTTVTVKEPV
jgi:organic hydroperoxide reductase OsmC/OhrA